MTTQNESLARSSSNPSLCFQNDNGRSKERSGRELAVVITIRPTDTEPFTNDLSMLLIEKNIRQLGFTGFIAVNLFRTQKRKVLGYFLEEMMNNLWKY